MDYGIAETGIARGSPPGTTTEVLRSGVPFAEIRVVSTTTSRNNPRTYTSTKPKLLPVQACTGLTGAPHRSDRCDLGSSTSNSLPLSPGPNCPHTRLGPGHLYTRLKYTIGRVVLVPVSPILCHSLLSLRLEAKLILMAISPTIATIEPHKLRPRLGMWLLTRFLSTQLLHRFPFTSFLTFFPKEHFLRSAHKLDRLLEIICGCRKHG
jgi:hypothetical protein